MSKISLVGLSLRFMAADRTAAAAAVYFLAAVQGMVRGERVNKVSEYDLACIKFFVFCFSCLKEIDMLLLYLT